MKREREKNVHLSAAGGYFSASIKSVSLSNSAGVFLFFFDCDDVFRPHDYTSLCNKTCYCKLDT